MPHDIATNRRPRLVEHTDRDEFALDYERNAVLHEGKVTHLSPHETDILYTLLNNRGRVTSMETLIRRVYGTCEPETAEMSIRVTIHSLRKKLLGTGIAIKSQAKLGYEIEAPNVPRSKQHLADKILLALNTAKTAGHWDISKHLQIALELIQAKENPRPRPTRRAEPLQPAGPLKSEMAFDVPHVLLRLLHPGRLNPTAPRRGKST